MRFRYGSIFVLASACASHLKTEIVGNGMAVIQKRQEVAAGAPGVAADGATAPVGAATTSGTDAAAVEASAAGIPLARGVYDFALHFDLPRAQRIDYTVTCPGVDQHGSIGETFESYRERRLVQLRAQVEQDRRNVSAVTGAFVGAVAPSVHAQGQASGPAGTATVDANVSGQAVGAAAGTAVANAAVQDVIELPPGDVGGGRLQTRVHVTTADDGVCVVTAAADDTNLGAGFEVLRTRDLDAEARVRIMTATSQARKIRGELNAQLVSFGADVTLRQRRREAEARARYEAEVAEARVRAEAQAQLEVKLNADYVIEVHRREVALQARAAINAYLMMCGADPQHRARVRAEAEAKLEARNAEVQAKIEARTAQERAQIEARDAKVRVQIEARDAERRARDAERSAREAERARRTELAFGVRAQLRAYLVGLGARERPPMPAPIAENPGSSPFAGASWIAGHWVWSGARWQWEAGGWRDTTVFGAVGRVGGSISVGTGSTFTAPPTFTTPPDRDHRTTEPPPDRDHRTTTAPPPPDRDHRTTTPPPPPARDHRGETSTPPPPNPRDHRKKDDDKKDDPDVRDHRH